MVNWPACIKYTGDAELVCVSSQSEWDRDEDLHGHEYDESDCLVDSSGQVFSLNKKAGNHVEPAPSGEHMTLGEVLEVVRAHASQSGTCCVAKLSASSVREAIHIAFSIGNA